MSPHRRKQHNGKNTYKNTSTYAGSSSRKGSAVRTTGSRSCKGYKGCKGSTNGSTIGTVEQVVLRAGLDGRTALILRSPTAGGLLSLLHDLRNPSVLGGLGGAVSVVDGGTEIRQVDLGTKVTVGNRTLASQLKQSIRGSWGLLGMGVLISAVLLAMIVQGWASRRGGHTG